MWRQVAIGYGDLVQVGFGDGNYVRGVFPEQALEARDTRLANSPGVVLEHAQRGHDGVGRASGWSGIARVVQLDLSGPKSDPDA